MAEMAYYIYFETKTTDFLQEVYDIFIKMWPNKEWTIDSFGRSMMKGYLGSIWNVEESRVTNLVNDFAKFGVQAKWYYGPKNAQSVAGFRNYQGWVSSSQKFSYLIYTKNRIDKPVAENLYDALENVFEKKNISKYSFLSTFERYDPPFFICGAFTTKEMNDIAAIAKNYVDTIFYVVGNESFQNIRRKDEPGYIEHQISVQANRSVAKEVETKKKNNAFNTIKVCSNFFYPYNIVGVKDRIEKFQELFKYALNEDENGYSKPNILRAFLALIISDSSTYSASESSNNTLKSSSGTQDWELNGYDLFNKYINYDLGENYDTNWNSFKYSLDYLNPNPAVCRLESAYTSADELILTFAVRLHSLSFFSDAVKMYQLYLAQQEEQKSLRCALVHYYIELAKNSCCTVSEQRTSSSPLPYTSIKPVLYQLYKTTNNADIDKLSEAIINVSLYQKDFTEFETQIKKIYDGRPENTIDSVDELKRVVQEMNEQIKKVSVEDVAVQLKENFGPIIKNLESTIKKLKAAKQVVDQYYKDGFPSDSILVKSLMKASDFNPSSSESSEKLDEELKKLEDALQFDGANKADRLAQIERIKPGILKNKDVASKNATRNKVLKAKEKAAESARIKRKESTRRFVNALMGFVFGALFIVPLIAFVYGLYRETVIYINNFMNYPFSISAIAKLDPTAHIIFMGGAIASAIFNFVMVKGSRNQFGVFRVFERIQFGVSIVAHSALLIVGGLMLFPASCYLLSACLDCNDSSNQYFLLIIYILFASGLNEWLLINRAINRKR